MPSSTSPVPSFPALFIDRDGVVIRNRQRYIRSWQHVSIYPRAVTALARLVDSPYRVVLITNQAGVAKGLYPLSMVEEINARLTEHIVQAGGRIDGIFVCPHRPEDNCSCRKPHPGLLVQAAAALSLDLARSFMIGDALSDIEAGQRAGVRQTILVRTGRGTAQLRLPVSHLQPFWVRRSLSEAVISILSLPETIPA